ncbi:interferon-induced very large GTPase 1 [Mastacembelus armatus]|uniref:interferon-induced very large GTPase 1 n=1 Tax=Mastacembelus armatus TaxID=205130 RepID=UPI000E464FA8|nr:interferon-induced very large GTPase 1-like [Mastacembelus armatus]
MSFKSARRLTSKRKKPPKDNAQVEVLNKLGLETFWTTPLDPASMLDISTWTLENKAPQDPKDLPNAFLQRLWMLSPDARSSCCKPPYDVQNDANKSSEEKVNHVGEESQYAIHPLDLVTAVFMSSNTFLQQEMTMRMVQCQFAVPLVLPNIDPEEPSHFLLWPMRGVLSQWRSHFPDKNRTVQEGHLASTCMPMVSCVKLGLCSISKSQVLNHVIRGLKFQSETFLHRGVDGGELPRRLSNGLVEIGWYRPTGDTATETFPVPVVISNLRGDATMHEKCLNLLCQASSVVVVFSGNLREKEKQVLASCREMARKLILIDLSDESEKEENRVVGFVGQNLEENMGLPEGSVLQGGALSEEELANKLCDTLKDLLPDLLPVTVEAAAKLAEDLGLNVDEGPVCKNVMATVDEMLKGLDEGSAQFREKQLPLQGPLWSKLAKIEKEESKHKKEGKEIDPQLQKDKKDILAELGSYKMTPVMKIFTNALFTTDKMERTYFLSWMKLRLQLKQIERQNSPQALLTNLQTENISVENENIEDSDSFCTDSSFDAEQTEELPVNNELQVLEQHSAIGQELEHTKQHEEPELALAKSDVITSAKQLMCPDASSEDRVVSVSYPSEPDPFSLGLEHFLREMGLIFELTHISPGSGSHNVLRLPSLAADLLLYGIPLELMDGDAANIPMRWLSCVIAELKRRLPQQCRTRALTNIGVHHAGNAEVLSALFGVKFAEGRKRSTRGIYMNALCLPDNLRKDMECDYLLLIDVEGLGLLSQDNKINPQIHDNEMATVATGLSDVLMQNISPHGGSDFEAVFTVIVNALLRIRECGSAPICELLTQDERINSLLQATQLRRVSEMLQAQTENKATNNGDKHYAKTSSCITCVRGPWSSIPLSEPCDKQYSKAVLKLKQNLFGAIKKCATKSKASSLSEFISHLCAVWDAVKTDSFAIRLQNADIPLAFSLLCTEFYQWEGSFDEHMESWLMAATHEIFATKAKALDHAVQNDLLSKLKDEAREEIRTEVDKLRSKVEASLTQDDLLKINTETFKPILMSNVDDLQERKTEEIMQRLDTVNESHCSSTRVKKFKTLLGKEQESKLLELVDNSKSTKVLLQDAELEEEFEVVWCKTLSGLDLRPSETDDITTRVTNILKDNLISRGLQKHMKKLEVIDQNQKSNFQINDDHFGYRNRLKHMFEDNNRLQRLEAQQVACTIIEKYKQFAAEKSCLPTGFSDSYITELLENVENALKEKSMEIRSAFEVDLKVYLCSAAIQDFQKQHAKDTEILRCISAAKSTHLAEFIYEFRKKDQCQRVAQSFTTTVFKPTVLDYIYRPLGMKISKEVQAKEQQFQSPHTFHQNLLEDLIKEDCFERFLEYLHSYDSYRLKKIQETVLPYLSESLDKWRQQRLGEIVGKIAAAVSQVAGSTGSVLSDTKPLLESVCLTLEGNADVEVNRTPLEGPLFSITTEWDRFVTCLMELLAALRLNLVQEFSQNSDITQLLQSLPIQPQHCLFSKVRGCDKQCPLCGTPCEVEEVGHEVHRAVLHRPKGVLPFDSCSLSYIGFSEIMTQSNPGLNNDAQNTAVARGDIDSSYLNWDLCPEDPNSQMFSPYWRYVLVRFNEKFAKEYQKKPASIPEEWRKITQEEALDSLKEVFLTKHW